MIEVELFLMIKYGSIDAAFKAWMQMSYKETKDNFTPDELSVLLGHEQKQIRMDSGS